MGFLRREKWPVSVLEALEVMLTPEHQNARLNSRPHDQGGPQGGQEQARQYARNLEALLLIVKDLVNQADRAGMESQLFLEDVARREGWTLFGPGYEGSRDDGPGEGEDEPFSDPEDQ